MKLKSILLLGIMALAISSCATFPQETEEAQKSNLTVGMVKTKIIKGETTQAEILQIFGSPNIITKNRNNDEVWNYNRMSFKSVAGTDSGVTIFWAGSRAMTSATTKSFDLIIIFDDNDVVKDYSVISAQF
jgi:predicted oxidoreductase (fatty acid repression mutant protein)